MGQQNSAFQFSTNVFDTVRRFIDETGRLLFAIFTSEPYCYFVIIWVLLNTLFLIVVNVGVHV